jgi:hypothetical protein
MDTLPRIARALSLVLPLTLVASTVVLAPASVDAGESDKEKEYDQGAKVTIEVRMEDGTVVKHRGEMRSFGTEWRFEFDGADHRHGVLLTAESEDSKTFEVTLAYERDGTPVIAPFTDTYTAKKRQALWTEDGSLAIALTFFPTKFEREDKSRDDKDKIKPDDSDDPLGGGLTLK